MGGPTSTMVCNQICGDGLKVGDFVGGADTCDEGSNPVNTGCKADCTGITNGFDCTTASPTTCTTFCGDGIHAGNFINGIDSCDEGLGAGNNSGCKSDCTGIITGFECNGGP
jgi:hypothetical protein